MRHSSIALVLLALVLALGVATSSAAASDTASGTAGPAVLAAIADAPAAMTLQLGTGYTRVSGSRRVRAVQRTLRDLGHRPGPVDGLFGPRTRRAVLRFQRAHDLRADGIVGASTATMLRSRQRAMTAADEPNRTRPVQPPTPAPAPTGPSSGIPTPVAPDASAPSASSRDGGSDLPVLMALTVALLLIVVVVLTGRPRRPSTAIGRTTSQQMPSIPSERRSVGPVAAGHPWRRSGDVPPTPLTLVDGPDARAGLADMATAGTTDGTRPLLSSHSAHRLHAVALTDDAAAADRRAVPVAVSDPSQPVLAALATELRRPIEPRVADAAQVDEMLRRTYGAADVAELSAALRTQRPLLSASTSVSRRQKGIAAVVAVALASGMALDLTLGLTVLVSAATALYVATTALRIVMGARGWPKGAAFDATPRELADIDDADLAAYTILVPLYREKEATLRVLFAALAAIDYPDQRIDCMLLLEEADHETRAAVERAGCPAWFRRIVVPAGGPQTKPMAMVYGLRMARGEFVTIYDAEDKPDPLQLRRAIRAFGQGGARLACLQAKLAYYNPRQNLLTRLFTLEYDSWFNLFLPGLARMGAPLPLGGTSNHFRRVALEESLAWDPYNVTEDADLGVRLARSGWQVGLLESTTEEEANSRVGNWVGQRSRWVKGYLQTFLVHFRQPRRLVREIGFRPTAILALTMGGSVLTALLTPICWALIVLWFAAEPAWLQELFPGPVFYPALASLVVGNFALVFFGLVAAVGRGHDDLAPASLCFPLYWLLISAATYLAVVELVRRPHHWHKTEHGLHFEVPERVAA